MTKEEIIQMYIYDLKSKAVQTEATLNVIQTLEREQVIGLATTLMTKHDRDTNADKCYTGLDNAYFSMGKTDFGYMLHALQNKVNIYKEMIKG
jgi:hypothetical protein